MQVLVVDLPVPAVSAKLGRQDTTPLGVYYTVRRSATAAIQARKQQRNATRLTSIVHLSQAWFTAPFMGHTARQLPLVAPWCTSAHAGSNEEGS